MIGQSHSPIKEGEEALLRSRWVGLLQKVGSALLGVGVLLYGIATVAIINGTSTHNGWYLIGAFITFFAGGLGLIIATGLAEAAHSRRRLPNSEGDPSGDLRAWEGHWEELMRRH